MGIFDQTAAACSVGLASAAGFATSNALQHRAAGRVPETVKHALAVLAHLARQRIWVIATAVSFGAMLLHALALRIGSLALVQPLMLVGVVLAVPLRAAVEHKRPTSSELQAVSITVAGLALFVVCTNPSPSHEVAAPVVLVGFVGVCVAVALLALRGSQRAAVGPKRQAALLGAGAGLMFGVTAGLLKTVGNAVAAGHPTAIALTLVCLVGAGLLGTAMNQRAYQIAPLAFSMPLVNVVDIIVAVLFGVAVFGESPAHGAGLVVLQAVGLGITAVGLCRISSLEPSSLPTGRIAVQEAWA
jgi:drug/metabolite transporter (DMT)-like permease